MAGVGGEELEHPGVAPPRLSGQDIADRVRKVPVSEGERIGVAEGVQRHRVGGPLPHPGHRPETLAGLLRGHAPRLLEPARRPGDAADGVGALTLDAEAVVVPARSAGEGGGGGGAEQPARPRRGLAEGTEEGGVSAPRLLPADPLLDDGGDQRLEDPSGAGQPQARQPVPERRDQACGGAEAGVVVELAGERRRAVECPGGARPPRLRLEPAGGTPQVEGGRPQGGAGGPPDLAVAEPHRRVARAAPQRAQGEPEVDGEPRCQPGPERGWGRRCGGHAAHGGSRPGGAGPGG